jgi:malic enzyme
VSKVGSHTQKGELSMGRPEAEGTKATQKRTPSAQNLSDLHKLHTHTYTPTRGHVHTSHTHTHTHTHSLSLSLSPTHTRTLTHIHKNIYTHLHNEDELCEASDRFGD